MSLILTSQLSTFLSLSSMYAQHAPLRFPNFPTAQHIDFTPITKSLARFTISFSISVAYGTGASSMHRRNTGASSSSNRVSETSADMVAPTPPLRVDSSRIASLCVRFKEVSIVALSNGFKQVSSIRSTSYPSVFKMAIASSDSFVPCRYVNTVTALPFAMLSSEATCCSVALCRGRKLSTVRGPFVFISFTGNNKTPGPLSLIILFASP
mmetsp:Transcript_3438/g.12705  ORF Transcript_3438/g.12705 Transcript_3438/m.12705 type:complete len:210 (-) Transcript_3438:1915-2544(-)